MQQKVYYMRRRAQTTFLLVMLGILVYNAFYVHQECFIENTITSDHKRMSMPANILLRNKVIAESSYIRKPMAWMRYMEGPKSVILESEKNNSYIEKMKMHPQNTFREEVIRSMGFDTEYTPDADWDLLMTNSHTYELFPYAIKPHQKISVIPGQLVVASKPALMRNNFPFMPVSFQMPQEKQKYIDYAKNHPKTQFLKKSPANQGRGVKFVSMEDVLGSNDSEPIQQFIDDPLLVDGRKIEVAMYAVATSVNPLRVYVNEADWYFRICQEIYYPFDINRRNKYILQTGSHLKTWQMPSLANYDAYNLTHRDTFLRYLKDKGYDTSSFDDKLKEIVRTVFTKSERIMIAYGLSDAQQYGGLRNFYNLFRFDFVLDRKLNIYLVEVNCFPGISVYMRGRNREQYTRLLGSLFHLVGAVHYRGTPPFQNSWLDDGKLVTMRDLSTFTRDCVHNKCIDNCRKPGCELCVPCMSREDSWLLADAFREHSLKYDWSRVFPKPFKGQEEARSWLPEEDPEFLALEPKSRWMSRWFWGKCLKNAQWCF